MADIKSLIKEKSRRLELVPDTLLSQIEKTQKQIFAQLMEILSSMTVTDGKIELTLENLTNAERVAELLPRVFQGTEYEDAIASFAGEFDKQAKINEQYFKTAFEDFGGSEVAEQIVKKTKQAAVEGLIGGSLDENFLKPAEKLLTDLVSSGADFKEAILSIRQFAEGGDEVDGKLLKYAKQIAHDQFAFADRGYTNAAAEEMGAEWYFYSGGEIQTTRCFCDERNGLYFHFREIEAWGRGENLGECKSGDLWAGAHIDTNAQTIFIYAGGYNCLHSLVPVSIFDVPKDVIRRNIDNGNYSPTPFEVEEMGL